MFLNAFQEIGAHFFCAYLRVRKLFYSLNFFDVMKKEKTTKQLEDAWVCELANRLMDEGCMTRSEAFRRAHLVKDLLEKLGEGRVTFLYEKQDGTTRQARGTLCHGVSEGYDNYRYKKIMTSTNSRPNDLYFTYWDLDREAFRAFSALRIVKIIGVTIPNYTNHG